MVPSAAHPPQQRTGADGGLAPDGLCSAASVSASEFKGKPGETTAPPAVYLMMGLKRMSRVLMNMVGCTMYRALMFFLYLWGSRDSGEAQDPRGSSPALSHSPAR